MSDDDRDVDIESDEDLYDGDVSNEHLGLSQKFSQHINQADRRAHHNALERKRRDHIKDSFSSLRDSVPSLQGEKASRAQILKKAAEYIQFMRRKNSAHQQDINDLKRQNQLLESQIRGLEKAKATGNYSSALFDQTLIKLKSEDSKSFDCHDSDHSDCELSNNNIKLEVQIKEETDCE